jgi:hypothetical protein
MAIASKKDTDHAENKACIYRPEDGTDVFDVSLVLCSDPCKLLSKNYRGSFLLIPWFYLRGSPHRIVEMLLIMRLCMQTAIE